jgi:hypothetical protein
MLPPHVRKTEFCSTIAGLRIGLALMRCACRRNRRKDTNYLFFFANAFVSAHRAPLRERDWRAAEMRRAQDAHTLSMKSFEACPTTPSCSAPKRDTEALSLRRHDKKKLCAGASKHKNLSLGDVRDSKNRASEGNF